MEACFQIETDGPKRKSGDSGGESRKALWASLGKALPVPTSGTFPGHKLWCRKSALGWPLRTPGYHQNQLIVAQAASSGKVEADEELVR